MISIPTGHIYTNALRRSGRVYNHEYIFHSRTALLFELYSKDDILVQLKNFRQVPYERSSEVNIVRIIDNIARYGCVGFTLTPTSIDGVNYSGGDITIPFSTVLGIEAANSNPFQSSPSKIYALTSPIQDAIAQVYIVPYTVSELWYYMNNCQFPPSPYYGDGEVLGGDVFLNL